MDEPDKYTIAWWREQFESVLKGYRGATHAINRCLADYEDCWNAVRELQQRCEKLETERDAANAEIARMRDEFEERQKKQRDWIKEKVK